MHSIGIAVDVGLQAVPERDRDVLRRGDDVREERDVRIQALVVDVHEDVLAHQVHQPGQVHHHPRPRIDRSLDRDLEPVVVAVEREARAVERPVLLLGQLGALELVSGRELFAVGDLHNVLGHRNGPFRAHEGEPLYTEVPVAARVGEVFAVGPEMDGFKAPT